MKSRSRRSARSQQLRLAVDLPAAESRVVRSADTNTVDEQALPGLAKWMAGGFTFLSAILTFFGIKEGVLDRIVRTNARASLLVFCLIGLAVVAGAVAPVLARDWQIRAWVVVAAIAVLVLVVGVSLPDLDGTSGGSGWTWAPPVVAVVVVAAVARSRLYMPLIAAALVVGIACLGLGLYGAAKLSVEAKMLNSRVEVRAVEKKNALTISVRDDAMGGDGYLLVRARAQTQRRGAGATILSTRLFPDAAGTVDRDLVLPLPDQRVAGVEITARDCTAHGKDAVDDERDCTAKDPVSFFLRRSLPGAAPLVGGDIHALGAHRLNASVHALRVSRDKYVIASLVRVIGSRRAVVTAARLVPAPDGSVRWSITVPRGVLPERGVLQLRAAVCKDHGKCRGKATNIAAYGKAA